MTRFIVAVLVGAGLPSLPGCGKSETDHTPINRTLGDSPAGAPLAHPQADAGILADQTAYRPAEYEKLSDISGGGAAGAGGAGATGPDAEAIRGLVDQLLTGIHGISVDPVLSCFDPAQIAALTQDDYKSTMYDLEQSARQFAAVFKDKAAGTDLAPVLELFALHEQGKQATLAALRVELFDAENGLAKVDDEALQSATADITAKTQEIMAQLMPTIMTAVTQVMAGGATQPVAPSEPTEPDSIRAAPPEEPPAAEGSADPGVPAGGLGGLPPDFLQNVDAGAFPFDALPVRKVEGQWRIALPAPISEEQAELANEAMILAKDYLIELTSRVETAPTFDAQTFVQLVIQTGMSRMPQAMALMPRVQALMGEEP